ncbi:MAG: homoserine dehydrogenase [Sumerlaeia bacterium]
MTDSASGKPLHLALVGFGNIGTGVVRHLLEHGPLLNSRLPRPLRLKTICDKDLTTDRGVSVSEVVLTDDFKQVVADPDIECVIELVGGTTIAKSIVDAALRAGKHVVTANKALIATYGGELFEAARAGNAQLLYEASVGAGIPIIRSFQQSLLPNRIDALFGILNGTCNYILTAMEDRPGAKYADILKEAMAKGYAEPDPTLDVEGDDTAHKIAILAALAFGKDFRATDVLKQGVTRIAPADVEFAASRGMSIKLLASAKKIEGHPALSVWPTFVPRNHLIGGVRDVLNALWVEGDPIGSTMMYGAGAGQGSTGSGVLSDVMLLAQAGSGAVLEQLNPLGKGERCELSPASANHPDRYIRAPGLSASKAAIIRGAKVLQSGHGWTSFLAPAQTASQRNEMLEGLASLGVDPSSVCEIHFAMGAGRDLAAS